MSSSTLVPERPFVDGPPDITQESALTIHHLVETRAVGIEDVVREFLTRIETADPELNAIVEVYPDAALRRARELQSQIDAGTPGGPLRGVPFGVKDLFDVADRPTLSGSAASDPTPKHEDSMAVRRLRDAGAILLAKTTTHEFAQGATTPQTGNPYDPSRSPGGSSGGSGAAVAANMLPIALGTDTGGSIRIPASLCGVAGFKGTFDSVPRTGVTDLSWSLDHAGPLAVSVRDCAITWSVLSGNRLGDADDLRTADLSGIRFALCREYFLDRLSDDVAANFEQTVALLESAGARFTEISLPKMRLAPIALGVIASVETASFHEDRAHRSFTDLQSDVQDTLRRGFMFSGVDYVNAQRVRSEIIAEFRTTMVGSDILLSPTEALTAPLRDVELLPLGDEMVPTLAALNALTAPGNILGAPALSVPNGFDSRGLPIGLQFMGMPGDDLTVLSAGAAFEDLAASRPGPP